MRRRISVELRSISGVSARSSYELVQADQLTMTAGTYNHPDHGTPFDERSKEFATEEKEN